MCTCHHVSLIATLVKNPPAMQETLDRLPGQEDHWRRVRLPTQVFLDFSCGSAGKDSTCSVGDLGLIPGLGRSPREAKGCPLQHSGLENSVDCYSPWGSKDSTEWLSLALFPPCFRNAQVGDSVIVGECQPLSKTVLFNVLKVTKIACTSHYRNFKTACLPLSPNQLIFQYK